MTTRYLVCTVRDGVAYPILTHHRTRTGAISRAESIISNRFDWCIVRYPAVSVVYSPTKTGLNANLTRCNNVRV